MTGRFDVSRILAPDSVKPRTHGPRDVIDANTPKAATTAPACTRTATPAAPPPAPVVHFTPRPSAPRAPDAPPKGKQGMRSSPNQQAILDAIAKHGTIKRTALPRATGLSDVQLGNALFLLGKANRIAIGGPRNDRIYGAPGTRFLKGTPVTRAAPSRDKDTPPPAGQALQPYRPPYAAEITDVTAAQCRAIKKADGGAIVLRGAQLTVELDAAELAVLRQL